MGDRAARRALGDVAAAHTASDLEELLLRDQQRGLAKRRPADPVARQ
jgi:hypothetical protein